MCGIAGLLTANTAQLPASLGELARSMAARIRWRGPDGEGMWSDEPSGVALAHRRLAVFAPGAEGAQPMFSRDRRYVICLNGAIYNHIELRSTLHSEGVECGDHSDTEVLVELIAHCGLEDALTQLNGMFAFAVFDTRLRELSLVRDRFGQKPLFYSSHDGVFSFGSELSVFSALRSLAPKMDAHAGELYLDFGFVPGARTVLEGVYELPAGCSVTFSAGGELNEPRAWWPTSRRDVDRQKSAKNRGDAEASATSGADFALTVDNLGSQLDRAVSLHLRADVPVGLFLSGGIDSGLVASYAAQHSPQLPAFIARFADDRYDESEHALRTATALDLIPHVVTLGPRELALQLHAVLDEATQPLADPSIIPVRALAEFASEQVTVVLGGDGADELFGGYDRYRLGADIVKRANSAPGWIVDLANRAVRGLPPRWIDAAGRRLARGRSALGVEQLSRRLAKASALLEAVRVDGAGYGGLRAALLARNVDPNRPPASIPGDPLAGSADGAQGHELLKRLMHDDLYDYMPDSVLAKVDRATMRFGIEARAPFLDPELSTWAMSVPIDHKIDARQSKRCLRALASRRISADLAAQPKRGFAPPLEQVFTSDVRERTLDLVDAIETRQWPDAVRERLQHRLEFARRFPGHGEHFMLNALTLSNWWVKHVEMCGARV